MAELVDARDLKSLGAMPRAGSSPAPGTNKINQLQIPGKLPFLPKQADCNRFVTVRPVFLCKQVLTEIEKEDEGYIRRERSYSTLCRSMAFPEEVNPDKAEATLKDGILEIKVAKKTPTKGRNVPVK